MDDIAAVLWRPDVKAEGLATEDVQVSVALGLERVVAEVREDAEPIGAVLLPQTDRQRAELRQHSAVLPELNLGHVGARDDQQHHGQPVEFVVENDYVIVFEALT